MSLAEKLDEIRTAGSKRIAEDKRVIMGAVNKELFEPNAFNETIESSELLAAGPVVLTVFRGIW